MIWQTKEIKNYILPVKNRTNLSTNWKIKLKQGRVSAESKLSDVFLCTGFWNSSQGPFISGEIPLGRLDLAWSLERDQALSLWSGSTDFKTLDYQKTNPGEYQIVRTHIKETTLIQDLASPNHQ